jgi:LysR family transcriptional regulator, cell division regulator
MAAMDLRSLDLVRAVAEAGSMSGAAERLGIAQSAVSARMGVLEKSIGAPLFERLPRGVALTAAGARLLPYTERVAELIAEARSVAAGEVTHTLDPFEVGATEIAAATVMPSALAKLMTSPEAPRVRLKTSSTSRLLTELDEGTLDAAVVSGNGQLGDRPHTALGELPLALAWRFDSTPEKFQQAFVFGEGCVCTDRLRSIDASRNWGLEFTRLGSLEAIVGCAAAGLGVALLPRAVLRHPELELSSVAPLRLILVYKIERQLDAIQLARSIRANLEH